MKQRLSEAEERYQARQQAWEQHLAKLNQGYALIAFMMDRRGYS